MKNKLTKNNNNDNIENNQIVVINGNTHNNKNKNIVLKKINIGDNDLTLNSLQTLTEYLQSINTKNRESHYNLRSIENFSDIEIDFHFTEITGRALITEIVQLNIISYSADDDDISSNNKTNSKNNNDGYVLTKIIEKFVHAAKHNSNITKIDLGSLPYLLLESSLSFTELDKKAKIEFDKEQNEIFEKKEFEFHNQSKDKNIYLINLPVRNTDFKSPFKFILNDINISLELLNSISNKLNFHPELSEKIFDHVTFIRRNKDSRRSLNHYYDYYYY